MKFLIFVCIFIFSLTISYTQTLEEKLVKNAELSIAVDSAVSKNKLQRDKPLDMFGENSNYSSCSLPASIASEDLKGREFVMSFTGEFIGDGKISLGKHEGNEEGNDIQPSSILVVEYQTPVFLIKEFTDKNNRKIGIFGIRASVEHYQEKTKEIVVNTPLSPIIVPQSKLGSDNIGDLGSRFIMFSASDDNEPELNNGGIFFPSIDTEVISSTSILSIPLQLTREDELLNNDYFTINHLLNLFAGPGFLYNTTRPLSDDLEGLSQKRTQIGMVTGMNYTIDAKTRGEKIAFRLKVETDSFITPECGCSESTNQESSSPGVDYNAKLELSCRAAIKVNDYVSVYKELSFGGEADLGIMNTGREKTSRKASVTLGVSFTPKIKSKKASSE